MEKREALIDAASLFSDELTEAVLEEAPISSEMLVDAVRKGTLERQLTPVFMGSAYKNKAVQPLLDAVTQLLPCPADVENQALDLDHDEAAVTLASDAGKPTVALAFKLEDGQYGQLTYIRVYQGRLAKGDTVVNVRTGRKVKIGRLCACMPTRWKTSPKFPPGISAPCSAWTVPRATPSPIPGSI